MASSQIKEALDTALAQDVDEMVRILKQDRTYMLMKACAADGTDFNTYHEAKLKEQRLASDQALMKQRIAIEDNKAQQDAVLNDSMAKIMGSFTDATAGMAKITPFLSVVRALNQSSPLMLR